MNIDSTFLEISFDAAGIRDSQKRLKSLIAELAVEPLKQHPEAFTHQFELVEEIVCKRIANVIVYWCRHKHVPASPKSQDKMSDITNTGKSDDTLEEFYLAEVRLAMETLAETFDFTVPVDYEAGSDELEYALLELEEKNFRKATKADEKVKSSIVDEIIQEEETKVQEKETPMVIEMVNINHQKEPARAIVSAPPPKIKEVEIVEQGIQTDVLNISTEHAWNLIYGLIGYPSEYIQQTMLPRWQQNPATFEQDRRFLYGLYIDTIRNTAGVQHIAGNFHFSDRRVTLDQMWQHYFADLSQRVAPQLTAARLNGITNETWLAKLRRKIMTELGNTSPIWILALVIALIFDGLTTYISLDQTPMEGTLVLLFSVLITALFQIADQLVINYRKREFEAEAMVAKYKAQTERISKTLQGLEITSDSYVNLSMERSKSHADWKAAEDNRKMARRGRFWSARIADINVIVTAYGFSFLFLNSEEPMYSLIQQFDYIFVKNEWQHLDLWVFLMVGLAITVSFVVNTAQRTEILGWSMRRLKNE